MPSKRAAASTFLDGSPAFFTVPEIATTLKMARSQVWDLIYKGELPVVRIKERTVRVARQDLEAFLAARRSAA